MHAFWVFFLELVYPSTTTHPRERRLIKKSPCPGVLAVQPTFHRWLPVLLFHPSNKWNHGTIVYAHK